MSVKLSSAEQSWVMPLDPLFAPVVWAVADPQTLSVLTPITWANDVFAFQQTFTLTFFAAFDPPTVNGLVTFTVALPDVYWTQFVPHELAVKLDMLGVRSTLASV